MRQRPFSQVQEDFEKVVQGLKMSSKEEEQKTLLIQLRRLIDEADQVLLEAQPAKRAGA